MICYRSKEIKWTIAPSPLRFSYFLDPKMFPSTRAWVLGQSVIATTLFHSGLSLLTIQVVKLIQEDRDYAFFVPSTLSSAPIQRYNVG
jgi:hypothetical protein